MAKFPGLPERQPGARARRTGLPRGASLKDFQYDVWDKIKHKYDDLEESE